MTSTAHDPRDSQVAVLIPAYNEAITIGKVVDDFKRQLPRATIYVFDNSSDDQTAHIAEDHGAIVVQSPLKGKGQVVRHMFNTVEADIFIMVDGDDTYPSEAVHELLNALKQAKADMVVGNRLENYAKKSFRPLHKLGNRLIAGTITLLFPSKVSDVLSGYRIFSREFVQTVYLQSAGFEIETEMTLQALIKGFRIREVPISYRARPAQSQSKLNTFLDGLAIYKAILLIFKNYKPLVFFLALSTISFIAGLVAAWLPVQDFITERYVHHVPLAILAASLEILAVLFLGIGLILNTITHFQIENHRMFRRLFRIYDRKYANKS